MKRILLAALATIALCSPAAAQSKRGLVTSGSCPLSCAELGVSAGDCREWQEGTRCFVEDYTQAPGHRTMARLPARGEMAMRIPESRPVAATAAPGNKAYKDSDRGLVTTARCPFSCADAGVAADACREWREGSKCFVEDLTQPPGHRTMMKLP